MGRPRIGRILTGWAAAAGTSLVAATFLLDPGDGPLALAAILVPHLLLVALLIGLSGLALDRGRWSIMAVAVLVVVAAARLGPEWLSLPTANAGDQRITVMSWNLEVGSRSTETRAGVIINHDADVVALQELTPAAAAALEADARIRARYPHRLLAPDPSVFGMGILSAFPIVTSEVTSIPPTLTATLDLGTGRRLNVLNAHPLPGTIHAVSALRVPIGFDGTERDASLRVIRGRIDDLLAADVPIVVIGDFNMASTEPAYRWLSAGLRDVHGEVGLGPGWTWRPSRLEEFGLGFLRIDYVFTGPSVASVEIAVDCRQPGDHCALVADLGLP
jgi:endonuclease/exonuclease/phosphatase (EEP) superfamily protein YafD